MQPTQEHIDHIRQQFAVMSSKEEFVELLNYAKKLAVGPNAKQFGLKQITYYSNPKVSGTRYKKFAIRKKSGGIRTIHAPVKGLLIIQRCLNLILQCVFTPHPAANGFVPNKSIVDNAKLHVGRNFVYNIDLKDFFSSIDQARVWKCLQLPPFNLIDKNAENKVEKKLSKESIRQIVLKFAAENNIPENSRIFQSYFKGTWREENKGRLPIANMIAALTCTAMEVERIDTEGNWKVENSNVLPQGAPTSPVITNIICQRLDFLLTGVAKRFGLKYSRYADDITFSSQHHVFKPDSEFINELHRIITQQGFHIKESKVRLQQLAFRQEVTGLLVNKNVNVQSHYVKQVRMWLYYWERYGYDRAYNFFLPDYLSKKTAPVKGEPNMANVISGKLEYLKMVKGHENKMYLKLKNRFDLLVDNTINPDTDRISHLDKVLSKLINSGVDDSMDLYLVNK